ncbi:MAG TPA: histidine kinase [Ilumatobacteraceae bacterium]|nr:histidine kinase [Ilumatobacteraceae bacterium]
MTLDWLRPDRRQSRELSWFAADIVLALMFVWITVESLNSTAYVDEFGPVEGAGWWLAISPTLLLPLRRIAPVVVLAAATALYMLASTSQGDTNALLAVPFFTYSVGITRPAPASGGIVGVASIALSTVVLYGPGDPEWLALPVTTMLAGIGWLIALSIRHNQLRANRLALEAMALRHEQDLVAERAVADERVRIARELHDAVGHAVNVMVLHAGAARLATDDPRTAASLREIEETGRAALTDLDHMLGLLHADVDAPLTPIHGSADIARLVDEMNAAGANVHLHQCCDLPLERRVGIAAYRIVQESLTNAIKHAGAAHIEVTLSCVGSDLEILVVDDGVGAPGHGPTGGGRGIVGMRERASVLGGRLEAGPGSNGGFRVRALLPRGSQRPSSPRSAGSTSTAVPR